MRFGVTVLLYSSVKLTLKLCGSGVQDWLLRLEGAWQLVFSAPNKAVPAWSYIPVNEDAVFDAGASTISLASDLGPLHFDFCGDFAWDARTQVRKLLLFSLSPVIVSFSAYAFPFVSSAVLAARLQGC